MPGTSGPELRRKSCKTWVFLSLAVVIFGLAIVSYFSFNGMERRTVRRSSSRPADPQWAKSPPGNARERATDSKPLKSLTERSLDQKVRIRAAIDRLWLVWNRSGYAAKFLELDGRQVSQGPIGTWGHYLDKKSDSPSEFRKEASAFNRDVWNDDASVIAFAELLQEERDPEKRALAAEYMNLADADGVGVADALKRILTREGTTAMVAVLKSSQDDYVAMAMLKVLGLQGVITLHMPQLPGRQDALPLSESSADDLADWYGQHRPVLKFVMAANADVAIAQCGQYSRKVLEILQREAFAGDNPNRVLFAKALCDSASFQDAVIPRAMQLLEDQNQSIRQYAIESFSRASRVSAGSSEFSDLVYTTLVKIAQTDADRQMAGRAFNTLCMFDRPDAFRFVQSTVQSDDRGFAGVALMMAEELRLEDHKGYPNIRGQMYDVYSSIARDVSASVERRVASYWVMYRTIYRRALEKDPNAPNDLQSLVSEMQQSNVPAIHQRLKDIQLEVQAVGGKVGLTP